MSSVITYKQCTSTSNWNRNRNSPSETPIPSRALLLGMVYSKEVPPKRGQMFRDRIRCQALENHGYEVCTLDDKHGEELAETAKHCRSNFANGKRMFRNVLQVWSSGGARGERTETDIEKTTFDVVILDYFFSPAGWVNTRWTEKFFSETLPLLVQKEMLRSTGSVWLPHLDHVDAMLTKFADVLAQYYTWSIVDTPSQNPLYNATDSVRDELLRCPDNLTNETQILPLMELPGGPFYQLIPRGQSSAKEAKMKYSISPIASKANEVHKRKFRNTAMTIKSPELSPAKKSKKMISRPKK